MILFTMSMNRRLFEYVLIFALSSICFLCMNEIQHLRYAAAVYDEVSFFYDSYPVVTTTAARLVVAMMILIFPMSETGFVMYI